MIFTWVTGDVIKTIYYVKTGSPLQLICTGSIQMTTDAILIFQIIFFYKNTKRVIEYRRVSNRENTTDSANLRKDESKEKEVDTARSANTDLESNNSEDVTNIVLK